MSHDLSYGALARICQGEDLVDPILQVLGHKPIPSSDEQERFVKHLISTYISSWTPSSLTNLCCSGTDCG